MDSPRTRPSEWATVVHRGPGFVLGKFECPAGASAWAEENWIGEHHHIVFPRTSVLIEQRGAEVVGDPNVAVLYNAGDTYSRRLIDPLGDRCSYAALSDELVEEVLGPAPRGERARFGVTSAPVDARVYALQWVALRAFETGAADDLALDERVLAVLGAVLEGIAVRAETDRNNHRRLVERTKRVLNERLNEPLKLGDIASLVHVSPYHLTRTFRRYTGMPIHRYRTHLRLRMALGRLERRREPLGQVAISAGFSSHSHFSAKFRQVFGFTPVEWREAKLDPCALIERVCED